MNFKPYDYQKFLIDKTENGNIRGWFVDMGLGKTVCALTVIQNLLYDYCSFKKALIIAPRGPAETTWPDEVKKWEHLKTLKLHNLTGLTPKKREELLRKNYNIYVINRELVKWIADYYKNKWPFDLVVIDELSSFKSGSSQRFRALKKLKEATVIGLTGTPGNLMDLWEEIYTLDQGKRLGRSVTTYRNTYFTPGRRNGNIVYEWIPREGSEKIIYEKISDLVVSLKTEDYIQLPECLYLTKKVTLDKSTMGVINELKRDKVLEIENEEVLTASAGVLHGFLMQLAGGALYTNEGYKVFHDKKIEALKELYEEANGEPMLVAYAFKHEKDRILKTFPEARELKGPKDVEEWNNRKISMLVVHPASAGHGLNLQFGGSIAVWFGLQWSLELYQQFNKRLHRQGQKKPVRIYHIVAEHTVDERTLRALENKDLNQKALIEAVKAELDFV